jgi:predicted metal-binding membrane protein
VAFGLIAYLGDTLLHQMTEPGMPLAAYSEWIAPAIVLAAGVYQFTPFKRTAMMICSIENDTFRPGWIERIRQSQAFKQGLRLGAVCVGSCWSLMLLMFAVGHHRLDWMLVLGVIMAAERLSPWGRRLSWAVGLVLVIWAIFLVFGTPLAAHSH